MFRGYEKYLSYRSDSCYGNSGLDLLSQVIKYENQVIQMFITLIEVENPSAQSHIQV